jgi:hypothetical protein
MSTEIIAPQESATGAVNLPEPGQAAEPIGGSVSEMTAADFLLPAEAFVERCIAAHPGADALFSRGERGALVEAVRTGRPRIEVLDAIRGRVDPTALQETRSRIAGLAKGWDEFVVADLLANFAPEDDVAFVRQVYSQVFGREPTSVEALEAKFDLKSGRATRRELIERLGARAPGSHLSTDLIGPGGAALSKTVRPQIVLMRPSGTDSWIVAPEVWVQPAPVKKEAFQFEEGWILAGPKRSFPSGWWRLNVEMDQEDDAELILDVVANGGLDRLLAINLVGPARLGARFKLEPWHHFVEVRLRRMTRPGARNWLRIGDLSLVVSE